ncbi:MAG: Ig-like domain repeat protein, partial [Burkholderiales bacterium]|nr:Ig-like domain repeat protein [Burkholderiales bacterium]
MFPIAMPRPILSRALHALAAVSLALWSFSLAAQPTVAWTARTNGSFDGDASPGCGVVANQVATRSQARDPSGNVFVTGCAFNGQNNDTITYKINGATGAVMWVRTYSGSANGNDGGRAIAVDAEGNVVTTGFSSDTGQGQNIRTIKYNGATGAELWNVAYNGSANGNDDGWAIAIDAGGNVVATGASTDTGQGANIRTIKFNGATGAVLWNVAYNGSENSDDHGLAVSIDASGNVVVTGDSFDALQASNIRTIKYNGITGAQLWNVSYDVGSFDKGFANTVDASGNVVVTGFSEDLGMVRRIRTIKYSGATGAELWNVVYLGGAGESTGRAIALDGSGNVVLTGYEFVNGQGWNMRTIKYSGATGAQLWSASYNGSANDNDTANAVAVDPSGNVVVAGYSAETGQGANIRVIKYDGATGSELWNMAQNGSASGSDAAYSVGVDSSGNVLVTGVTTDTLGSANIRTIKYSGTTGAQHWSSKEPAFPTPQSVGGALLAAKAMAVDTGGNVFVTGVSNVPGQGDNFHTVKYSGTTGEQLWSASYNGSANGNDVAYAVAVDSSGDVVVTGYSTDTGQGPNIRTIKYNGATGAELWNVAQNGGANGSDVAYAVGVDSSGNVVVTGVTTDVGQMENFRTTKYNGATGALVWSRAYNGSAGIFDYAYAIAVSPVGDVAVTGFSNDIGQGQNIRTIVYNAAGTERWNVAYNGSANGNDFGYAIVFDAARNVVLTGYSSETGQGEDIRTIKYDGLTGDLMWTRNYNGGSSGADNGHDVTVDASDNVIVTGFSTDAGGQNIRTIKYDGATGAGLWNMVYGGSAGGNDVGRAVAVDASGDVLVTGFTNDIGLGSNISVIKFKGATGTPQWVHSYGATGNDFGHAIFAQGSSSVYVFGTSVEPGLPQGFLVQKLSDLSVPAAPSITFVSASNGQASVSFATSNDGGSSILDHTATCTSTSPPGSVSATGASSPITVTGLTNGITYTCTVVSRNAIGTSPASAASNPFTPKAASVTTLSGLSNSISGALVHFTASVTGDSPTGTVTFKDGASNIAGCANVALSAGSAQCATNALPVGARSLTAEYAGNAANLASISNTLSHTVSTADTVPDPFSFISQINVAVSSVRTSNTITVNGINTGAFISVSNGEYSPGCTGTFTSVPGIINAGQTVCVRHNASPTAGTFVTTRLVIGGVTGSFTSVTMVPAGSGGLINTVAGTGTFGFSGDGGAATAAQLRSPSGIALDGTGNLYIADTNNQRIRKVTPGGVISTVAGNGVQGFGGDGGAATAAQLNNPQAVAIDSAGNLYIADTSNHRIRKVTPDGVISTVAGTGVQGFSGEGGAATAAQLSSPRSVAVDGAGNLYIADTFNQCIRRVTPGGIISTVAGNATGGFSGDGGAATAAQLQNPNGVALDDAGNLYISDTDNQRIRRVAPSGVISTVAGNGLGGFSGDGGAATSAQLLNPLAIALDAAGNLYIPDFSNQRIRKVTPGGIISTVAGDGAIGSAGDGGAATSAQIGPVSVAIDIAGNLYISDQSNQRIRKVTVSTVPAAPIIGSPTAGNAQVSVAFTPGSDGGSPILDYTVTCTSASPPGSFSATGASSPIIVTGLSNFVNYICTVVARNAVGTSAVSTSLTSIVPNNGPYLLNINRSGSGTGSVTSSGLGINCGSTCSANVTYGTAVTLMSTPDAGSVFSSWSGIACNGGNSGPTCTFTLTANTTVTATFDPDITANVAPNDLNDDGRSDILWRTNPGGVGDTAAWLMNGTAVLAGAGLTAGSPYQVTHAGDFDGDGKADLAFQHLTAGDVTLFRMDGTTVVAGAGIL